MLAIRLQRLGRKGYPVYRLAVQEAQRHPSSGRVVAYVGSYNPHTKEVSLQKEAVEKYLRNGARPTPRIAKLLRAEGVTLPSWVKEADTSKQKAIRNTQKLRKNQPKEETSEEVSVEEPAGEASEAETAEPTEAS